MDRLHIAFFGPPNSGKSSLLNAICGQEVAMVSPVPGTTTDPVRKLAELPGIGPCVLIDTAGLGDDSILGPERERRTRAILDETDIAIVLSGPFQPEGSLQPEGVTSETLASLVPPTASLPARPAISLWAPRRVG